MADTDLTVYTLGQGGVDVDLDPVLTAPNETLQSQNATYDPTAQHAGGLTKRKGLESLQYGAVWRDCAWRDRGGV